MAATWIGSTTLTQTPDSPELVFGQTDQKTYHYEGPYADALAAKKSAGDTHEGLPVVSCRVVRKDGGIGRVSITAETTDFHRPGEERALETYEVDAVDLERPLLSHPIYQTGGAQALTVTDLADLEAWKTQTDWGASKNKPLYKYNRYTASGTWSVITLSAKAQHAAAKILRGVEAYSTSYPVARITSIADAVPSSGVINVYRTTKPFTACPSGYTWLKKVDRSSRSGRSGRWKRDIEYIGVPDLDLDLYAEET
jgi:hypothetical protein